MIFLHRFFLLSLLCSSLCLLLQCSGDAPQEKGSIVVLITLDTMRADALSCYGNPYGRQTTPYLDALAKEGAQFKTSYSSSGFTPLSHASMFSGLHSNRHAVGSAGKFFDDIPLLAEILQANNFLTSASVVSPPMEPEYGFYRGFDNYWKNTTHDARLRELKNVVTKAALQGKGAFVFLHYFDVHSNYPKETPNIYEAPAGFSGRYTTDPEAPLGLPKGMSPGGAIFQLS